MFKISFAGKSDVGLKRKNNEDAFVVSPEFDFCLAADGMGGAAAGELASRFFAETATEVFSGSDSRTERETVDLVQKIFRLANKRILDHIAQNIQHKGMGCTAELVAFSHEGFVLGHIGDSRTYRLRDGQLKQLTQDHSLVQGQIDQGLITPAEARNHRLRNVILRAVGVTDNLALDLLNGKIFTGDLFLLCSDGLTNMVEDVVIHQVLSSEIALAQRADKLIELANAAGGVDNVTVVLSEIL
jgi:serine/threonine protein phosphatase PrpC